MGAHSEDTLDKILTSIEWESTFGNMTIEKRTQFKQAINQNYISKDRVIKALESNKVWTKVEYWAGWEAAKAYIKKELGL